MTTITKEFAQDIIKGYGYGVAPSAVEALARIALASLEAKTMVHEPRNSAGAAEKCRSGENVQVVPPVCRRAPAWTGANCVDPRQSYIAGWNACRNEMIKKIQPSESIGNGWISVMERMPPKGDVVALICPELSEPVTGYITDLNWFVWELEERSRPISASHWMPLPASPQTDVNGCWCHACRPVTMSDMRFVVCPDCGNKRCPKANDHRNICTGSNEPGQEGSAYSEAPQQEDKR